MDADNMINREHRHKDAHYDLNSRSDVDLVGREISATNKNRVFLIQVQSVLMCVQLCASDCSCSISHNYTQH